MKKTSEAVKRQLNEQWQNACNDYLKELLRMWECDSYYGYWIGDEVGGVYDYDGSFTIGMNEVIYCVENDVTREQFTEWQDYICDAVALGFDTPDLRSWMKGCSRVNPETFDRINQLKADMNAIIEEEKAKVKNQSNTSL